MNFVGHSLFTHSSGLLIGNLCADLISPDAKKSLDKKIKEGIQYHYAIDQFTDQHSFFKELKSFLFPHYGHYARVIVDLYIDFFIVTNWNAIMSISYSDHVKYLYQELEHHKQALPIQTHYIIDHLIHYNWLGRYGSISGINVSFYEMSRRTPGSNCIKDAALDLLFIGDKKTELIQFLGDLKQHLILEDKKELSQYLLL